MTGMPSYLVTCPEFGHLAEIDLVESPLGLLIQRCSTWRRACHDCPRTCAARLDRRRGRLEPGTTLIVRSWLRR
jgi:hypothetical protein